MSSSLDPVPKKKSSAGKKRKPTFRPASQRKGASRAAPAPAATVQAPPSVTPTEDAEAEAAETNSTVNVAATSTKPPVAKRAKKRSTKVSAGVPIGLTRTVEATTVGSIVTLGEQPASQSMLSGAAAPPVAVPGQPTLQKFCSRYRTKNPKEKGSQPKAPVASSSTTGFSEKEGASRGAGPVVHVVNGEIVLQESSMVVPGARRSVQEVEEEFEQVVEEEGHTSVVGASYNSFVNRRAPQHWSVQETKKFYMALRQVGPDFATMEAIFDNRTRRQLKRKYQMENNRNPHLIELALNPKARIPLDLSAFSIDVDTTINGGSAVASTTNAAPQATSKDGTSSQSQALDKHDEEPEDERPKPEVSDPMEGSFPPDVANPEVDGDSAPPPPEPFFADETKLDQVVDETSLTTVPLTTMRSKSKSKRPKFKASTRGARKKK